MKNNKLFKMLALTVCLTLGMVSMSACGSGDKGENSTSEPAAESTADEDAAAEGWISSC